MKFARYLLILLLAPMPLFASDAGEWDNVRLGIAAGVGFFGALAFLVFAAGLSTYLSRLGTEHREEGIKVMEKGLSILIVVIIFAGILRWLQS